MERHSKPNKKSWKYDEREIPRFLTHWFSRRISTITKEEIARLHAEIGAKSGKVQANHILERIWGMYSKAIEWGWDGSNPAWGLKKFPQKSRDRFLGHEEMGIFWTALSQEENKTARDFFKILLFTGARKTNTLQMKWEDIRFKEKVWRIPDTKMAIRKQLRFALKQSKY